MCIRDRFYAAVEYEGKYYVDGGVLRNIPIKAFPEYKTLFLKFKENEHDIAKKNKIKNILQFVYSIIDTTSKYCNDLAVTDALHTLDKNIRMIEIDTYMVKGTDFNIDKKTKNFLVKQGEHAVSDYINKIWLDRLIIENRVQRFIQTQLSSHDNTVVKDNMKKILKPCPKGSLQYAIRKCIKEALIESTTTTQVNPNFEKKKKNFFMRVIQIISKKKKKK